MYIQCLTTEMTGCKYNVFIVVYPLPLRMEELTDPELIRQNAKCDRKVSLYGYVRGAHLKHNSKVHIIGTYFFMACKELLGNTILI